MSNEPPWAVHRDQWPRGQWNNVNTGPRKKITYTVRVLQAGTTLVIVERLGVLWEHDDGSWDWRRFKSRAPGWTTGRGLSPNKGMALLRVLEGWD
jgi:hypothetical protein